MILSTSERGTKMGAPVVGPYYLSIKLDSPGSWKEMANRIEAVSRALCAQPAEILDRLGPEVVDQIQFWTDDLNETVVEFRFKSASGLEDFVTAHVTQGPEGLHCEFF